MTHARRLILGTLLIMLGLSGGIRPASAALEYNLWIPFTDDFDSCTGERVVVSGKQHIVGTVTVDGTGRSHFTFTRHMQGTGVGVTSGADYLLIDSVAKSDLIGVSDGATTVFTQMSQELFIRKGESSPHDDSMVQLFTHITTIPGGEITVSIDVASASCR